MNTQVWLHWTSRLISPSNALPVHTSKQRVGCLGITQGWTRPLGSHEPLTAPTVDPLHAGGFASDLSEEKVCVVRT